jgi:hypothetical protein
MNFAASRHCDSLNPDQQPIEVPQHVLGISVNGPHPVGMLWNAHVGSVPARAGLRPRLVGLLDANPAIKAVRRLGVEFDNSGRSRVARRRSTMHTPSFDLAAPATYLVGSTAMPQMRSPR